MGTLKFALACCAGSFIPCSALTLAQDTPQLVVNAQEKLKEDFEKENSKWKFEAGKWERRKSGESMVLAQTTETQPWAVAILEDKKFSDVDISVRFRPISGKEDASGGIIFRAKDGKNYFLVRANALENNFRLYTMIDGKRKQLASAKVDPPKLGEWHTIRVVAKGDQIQAYLDGKLQIDDKDKTYSDGYVGLWTKADSVTEFDDLEVGVAVALEKQQGHAKVGDSDDDDDDDRDGKDKE
ncbi:MAG: DUF1080 domain-containing protein [Planctomycetes bacterium]|nr:DUF1080 domain-containing protein [Planctomycetota bacterium]MBI3843200.1 DUF1080 domain-containing protein [Planctomycetota bacterium]